MGGRRYAFTLIELLVVIAIVAILVAIAVPSLASARRTARMTREQAALRQMLVSYNTYAFDCRDQLIPAAPHWDWVHLSPGGYPYLYHKILPEDPRNRGYRVQGSSSKTWVQHLLWMGWLPSVAVQVDDATRADFEARDASPTATSPGGVNDFTARPGG